MPTDPTRTDAARGIPAPAPDGPPVTTIRVLYSDLHGIARGKDVPIAEFDHVLEHGLSFCAAVMGTDLRHTPVVGGEAGYPDLVARPDLATMVTLPWEPGVAACLADVEPPRAGRRSPTRAAPSAGPSPGWPISASRRSSAPSSSSSSSSATPPRRAGSAAASTGRAWSTRSVRRPIRAASCAR